jgi:oligopeptide transport system substrate-binding protein
MPKTFDPARAVAAPETDVVRALFDGLTNLDAASNAVPAIAEKWTSSPDNKEWTFYLRADAKWSNGKHITAADLIRSWKRLPLVVDRPSQRVLFQNIVGLKAIPPAPSTGAVAVLPHRDDLGMTQAMKFQAEPAPSPKAEVPTPPSKETQPPPKAGLVAEGDNILKVSLEVGDKDFAKLVADPIFRPIFGDGSDLEKETLPAHLVTNGPFRISAIGKDDISLERSDAYWNASAVELEHVRLIAKDTAEAALDAYKKGELDAVTNAEFEPLALKLLAPYEDLRHSTHGALNFYEVNARQFPFSDRRVREALAVAIDRERLTDVEMEGTSEPATRMLPVSGGDAELRYDIEHARDLLDKAGFPQGVGFPKIRLVVNRNETQQRVARAVARMWKQDLNLDTEIIVKEAGEIESVRMSGGFDLIRRGTVLPARDELVSLAAILGSETRTVVVTKPFSLADDAHSPDVKGGPSDEQPPPVLTPVTLAWTEADSLYELNVIPLYFPLSYSLVKPYVEGFEIDTNGSPDLREVAIDSSWQPKAVKP